MEFLIVYMIFGCLIAIVGTATGNVEIKHINGYYRILCMILTIFIAPLCILIGLFIKPKPYYGYILGCNNCCYCDQFMKGVLKCQK